MTQMSLFDPVRHPDPETSLSIIIELFAGAGGMSQALRLVRLAAALSVEIDPLACLSARLAGHARLTADVYALDPHRATEGRPAVGLLAAPPCQGFSGSGLKAGRDDLPAISRLVSRTLDGADHRAEFLTVMRDKRSILVVEPLRWALALRPEWIVLEQVPSVLPVWEAMAGGLQGAGYWTATGVVNAADHGVPQDRHRAVLLASRRHPVRLPVPTPGVPSRVGADVVLGPGSLGFPRRADRGATVEIGGRLYRARDIRRTEMPAFTVTEKARSWMFWPDDGAPRQITPDEAAMLQSFPAGYPWQGKRTPVFLQIANTHPPLLGAALLGEVL